MPTDFAGAPREVHERLGEPDLSEHLIPRDSTLTGSIKQDMSLFLCIFVVFVDWPSGKKRGVVDCEVEQSWGKLAHGTRKT